MKNTPGYWFISGTMILFSCWFWVPKSRFGSNPNAVVRVTPSRPSGLRTGWKNTSRFFSRRAFSQSVRASSSYMLRVIDSPAADSPPCGVAVTHANAGREPAASTPTSVEISPERTPRQKAASPSGPSSLSMFSAVPAT